MNKFVIFILLLLTIYAIIFITNNKNNSIKYSYEKVRDKIVEEKEENFIIPKNIIQSFSSRYVTEGMRENIDNWMELNKEYSYTYFDENEIVDFIKKYYTDNHLVTFYKINAGAGRADFFRYLYLYKFGGVWVDITLVCYTPLRKYIKNTTELVVVHDLKPDNIYNAFMGFSRGHPILKNCIEKCIKYVKEETFKEKKNYCIYHTTGPELIKLEYDNYFKDKSKTNMVVLTKELILKNNITKIIKDLSPYNCLYILLNGEKVIKTKFENAKKNLEFVSNKLHYKKINFFNDNLKFINDIPKLGKNRNLDSDKETSVIIKSSLNLDKLQKFYNSVKEEELNDYNIILVDDFSQNQELLEIYKKINELNIDVKINPIRRGSDIFIDSLNFVSEKSNFILYMEEERTFPKNFLNQLLEKNKTNDNKVLIDLSNHFNCFSLFFHRSLIEELQISWLKNREIGISQTFKLDQFKLTLNEELTS